MNQQSADSFENEMTNDVLERAIASISREPVPAGPPPELVAATLRALDDQPVSDVVDRSPADLPRPPFRTAPASWRKLMSRRTPRFAALVLLTATVCAVFGVLLRTRPTVAFANLADPILKAKTAKFNLEIEANDLPNQTVRMLVLEPNRLRQEMPSGQITIFDFNARRMLFLTPAKKSARLVNMTDMPAQQMPHNFFDLLRTNLRAVDADPAVKREPLGRKQIAGREAIGFRVRRSNTEMMIWGDPETGLPVVVEMKTTLLPNAMITMTDFEFDVELDESLFKTEPPEGYSVQELNVATPTEKDLIAALKLLCDDDEGRFPDTFSHTAIAAFTSNWVHKNPGKPDAAWTKKVTDQMLPLTQGLVFAATLPPESNARYAGKGVKNDDATTPVFWYKPVGEANYRVIYGDLSVKQQDAAPQSPNAVPVTLAMNVAEMTREMTKRIKAPTRLPAPEPPAPPRRPGVKQAVPLAPPEPAARPDDPAARLILDRMKKTYADCTWYADSGVVTTEFFRDSGKSHTTEKRFTTAFVRAGRVRFEFTDMHLRTGDRQARYIIWSDGQRVQTWWDVKPGIETPESLHLALGAANGVSGGSSLTIPALLLPDELGGGMLMHIAGAQCLDDGSFEDHDCFRVEGQYGGHPITVWIDKKSHLVRRIDEQAKINDFRTETTTTYDPSIDQIIADERLEFNPPVTK